MNIIQSVVFTLTCVGATMAVAGQDELNRIEQAFNAPDTSVLANLTADLKSQPSTPAFDVFIAHYRLAVKYQYSSQPAKAKTVVVDLVPKLAAYVAANPSDAGAKALLANVYGFATALLPEKAMEYGPLSQSVLQQALTLSPDNARVLLFKATLEFNTPTQFGGSKVKAQHTLEQAITAYEQDTESDRYWGHADAMILMGLTHLETGDNTTARDYWQQALALQPDNSWAQFLLNQH